MQKKLAPGFIGLLPSALLAQNDASLSSESWWTSPGIIGTFLLIALVLTIAIIIMSARLAAFLTPLKKKQLQKKQLAFQEELISLEESEIDEILRQRKAALGYKLKGTELGSQQIAIDDKGLVNQIANDPHNPLFDEKKKSPVHFETPPELKKVIIFYLGAAVAWLVAGTFIGEYVGMKFDFKPLFK